MAIKSWAAFDSVIAAVRGITLVCFDLANVGVALFYFLVSYVPEVFTRIVAERGLFGGSLDSVGAFFGGRSVVLDIFDLANSDEAGICGDAGNVAAGFVYSNYSYPFAAGK